jgi:hypothetical protein
MRRRPKSRSQRREWADEITESNYYSEGSASLSFAAFIIK